MEKCDTVSTPKRLIDEKNNGFQTNLKISSSINVIGGNGKRSSDGRQGWLSPGASTSDSKIELGGFGVLDGFMSPEATSVLDRSGDQGLDESTVKE